MAVRGLRLTILVFLVSSVAVNGRDGEPYILLGEKNLPNHSYIKIGQLIESDGVECRGVKVGGGEEEESERRRVPALWFDPRNQLVTSIHTRYRRGGLFLMVYQENVLEGLYKCGSELPITNKDEVNETKRVVYAGLFLNGGKKNFF